MSRSSALIVAAVVLTAAVVVTLVIIQARSSCPADWSSAPRFALPGSSGDVSLDGVAYHVGGSAMLDYMPRGFSNPLELFLYQLTHRERHGLGITASVSASSRAALADPEFTCVRAIHGSDVWAVRPTTYGTQTVADGYPPGAPSPVPNEAWRMAAASDGPEWPDGDEISLELWLRVNGRNYVFVIPPFTLMKGA